MKAFKDLVLLKCVPILPVCRASFWTSDSCGKSFLPHASSQTGTGTALSIWRLRGTSLWAAEPFFNPSDLDPESLFLVPNTMFIVFYLNNKNILLASLVENTHNPSTWKLEPGGVESGASLAM